MSIIFSKEELVQIKFDEERGFYYKDFYFDSLIGATDTELDLSQSIYTTENIVITWVICEGWIVLPAEKFGQKINYMQFTPLALFLNESYDTDFPYERQITCKEQMIDEHIELLQDRIETIKAHLNGSDVSVDTLIFITKEHRHPNITSPTQLLVALQKELRSWYNAKRKLLEYGTFDSSPIITESPSNYYFF